MRQDRRKSARGGRLTLDSDGNAARATANSQAIVLGADFGTGSWRIGAAYANDWGGASVPARASYGKWTGDSVAAYGGGALGPVAVRLGGAYGWYQLDVTRSPALSATASDRDFSQYRAELGQLFGELTLGKTLGRTRLEAFGRWTGLRLTTDAFAENGGADALSGQRRRTELGYTQAGARGSVPVGDRSSFTLSGAWAHAFGAITPAALLTTHSGTSLTVLGAPLARDAAMLSAAFTTQVGERVVLRVGYNGELAKGAHDHQLSGATSVKF